MIRVDIIKLDQINEPENEKNFQIGFNLTLTRAYCLKNFCRTQWMGFCDVAIQMRAIEQYFFYFAKKMGFLIIFFFNFDTLEDRMRY